MFKKLSLLVLVGGLLAGSVSAMAPMYSPELSSLQVDITEVPANGVDIAPLTLILRDESGQPLPHESVTIVARDMGTGDEWRDTFLVDGNAEINWSYSTQQPKTLRVRVEHEGVRFDDEAFIKFYYTPTRSVQYVKTASGDIYEIDMIADTRKYAPFTFDEYELADMAYMSDDHLSHMRFVGIASLYPGDIVGLETRMESHRVLADGSYEETDALPTRIVQDAFAGYYGLE